MPKVKVEEPAMSAFERRRLENMAANREIMKSMSAAADKIAPKPAPKPRTPGRPRKSTPVKRETPRPTRTSSRLAGIEAGSESAKRKAEVEDNYAKATERAKKVRVAGDLSLSEIKVEGKKFTKDEHFLKDIMRGAQPYERTFDEDDIKETTDAGLKELREKMSGLEIYETFRPNDIKITPERIYALGFHPTPDKALIFAGDKMGNMGIFDASQTGSEVKEEDDEDNADEPEPAIMAFKPHSGTITSIFFPSDTNFVYSSSYDSSVRKLDLQAEKAVEILVPPREDEELAISAIDVSHTDPNMLFFSTLGGEVGRHDIRAPNEESDIWQLTDKKIGGFSLHPLHPHLFATASLDRTLKIWDVRKITGKDEWRGPALLGEHTSKLSTSFAAFSVAGHVATTSYDNTIKIHSFPDAGSFNIGHDLDEKAMEPTAVIRHNNQTGRWVTILKAKWQQRPGDRIPKLVVGNMNRFVDVYTSDGEQLAQLGSDDITAVPAVAEFHPTRDWVAGGTASGKLCLWM